MTGSRWSAWQTLSGVVDAPPALASWGPGRLDLIARGIDHALYHKWMTLAGWTTQWEYMGGNFVGTPAIVASPGNRLDIVARAADNSVWHKAWNGASWVPGVAQWRPLGGAIVDSPRLVSSSTVGGRRLDVFARARDGSLLHAAVDPSGAQVPGAMSFTRDPFPTNWSVLLEPKPARGRTGGVLAVPSDPPMRSRDLAHLSDEALVALVGRSDELALAELYDRVGGTAYGLAYRVLRDESLAEDAVQEAFLGLWRSAGSFIPERAKASTWILTLVHRRAVDLVRREQRRRTEPIEGAPEPAVGSAEEAAWLRLDRERVQGALAQLPDQQREAIELAYYGGYTQSELAERLGQPLGTIKSRMFSGLTRLRELLEEGTERTAWTYTT